MLARVLATFVVFTLLLLFSRWALRRTFPRAWARWLRHVVAASFGLAVVGWSAWALGRTFDVSAFVVSGMTLSSVTLVTALVTAMALPVSLALSSVDRRLAHRGPPSPSRRRFLGLVAAGVPATAAASGPVGSAATLLPATIREVTIPLPELDPRLDGLKILQLTDVHLGAFIDTDHVKDVLERARPLAPDVVVLTGDIADDYTKLPATLAAVAELGAPLGAFACIGNHEVYRGRRAAEAIYAESAVRLLCDDGVVLERDGARLFVGGVDDPARLGGDHRAFLRGSVERTLAACPDDVHARVLLSHRPEGFETAARHGVDLVLSGHTHGGQVAALGRSIFERFAPRAYLLGHYQARRTHLYTSAGLGHWFPYRLNCPCEVVVVTLRRTAHVDERPRQVELG